MKGGKTGTVQGDFVIRFQSRALNPAEKCSWCGLDLLTHTHIFRSFLVISSTLPAFVFLSSTEEQAADI